MEKHFVNYNQSLALKKLGFDEPCFAYYQKSAVIGNDTILPIQIMDKASNFNDAEYSKMGVPFCSAPLKSQVFEFFREKYNWHNVPLGTVRLSDNKVVYNVGKPNIIYPYGKVYDTYEEAESACIDNLIENAKNK